MLQQAGGRLGGGPTVLGQAFHRGVELELRFPPAQTSAEQCRQAVREVRQCMRAAAGQQRGLPGQARRRGAGRTTPRGPQSPAAGSGPRAWRVKRAQCNAHAVQAFCLGSKDQGPDHISVCSDASEPGGRLAQGGGVWASGDGESLHQRHAPASC